MGRLFINDPEELGSIPDRAIRKTYLLIIYIFNTLLA